MAKRVTNEEKEGLQRRIWLHRTRGMTLEQIATAVGKSRSTVSHHLREARRLAYEYYESAGEQELVGEMLLQYREGRQEAMRNLARTQPASPQRLVWTQEVRQALSSETKFLMDIGLIRRAPDKLDVTVADVRTMTSEEIQRHIHQLQKELAFTPVRGVTAPFDPKQDIIDVPVVSRNAEGAPALTHVAPDDDDLDDDEDEPEEHDDGPPDDDADLPPEPPVLAADEVEFEPYGGAVVPPETENSP